jgi:hypothetical protein
MNDILVWGKRGLSAFLMTRTYLKNALAYVCRVGIAHQHGFAGCSTVGGAHPTLRTNYDD